MLLTSGKQMWTIAQSGYVFVVFHTITLSNTLIFQELIHRQFA